MIRPSRYIRARVVDFAKIDFAGDDFAGDDLAGPKRKLTPKQRQIRMKLRKAFRLKKRISHLKIRQPAGWMGAVRNLKKELRVVMSVSMGFGGHIAVIAARAL